MSIYMDEKRIPFMNSKIVNAKYLKVEFHKKKLIKYGIPIH